MLSTNRQSNVESAASRVGRIHVIVDNIVTFLKPEALFRSRRVNEQWKNSIDFALKNNNTLRKELFLEPAYDNEILEICTERIPICLRTEEEPGYAFLNPYVFQPCDGAENFIELFLQPGIAEAIMGGDQEKDLRFGMRLGHFQERFECRARNPDEAFLELPCNDPTLLRERAEIRAGTRDAELIIDDANTLLDLVRLTNEAVARWNMKVDWNWIEVFVYDAGLMRATALRQVLGNWDESKDADWILDHSEWLGGRFDGAFDIVECGDTKLEKTKRNRCCHATRVLEGLLERERENQHRFMMSGRALTGGGRDNISEKNEG